MPFIPAETPRLRLRLLTLSDTPFIISLLNSPRWLQFIGDRNVRSEEDARQYLLNGPLKSYDEHGFGLYLVELKDTREPVGLCGLLKREKLPHPDIGFAFLPEHCGKGYALESAESVMELASAVLALPKVLAICLPENICSIRLLEKIGMRHQGAIQFEGEKDVLALYARGQVLHDR